MSISLVARAKLCAGCCWICSFPTCIRRSARSSPRLVYITEYARPQPDRLPLLMIRPPYAGTVGCDFCNICMTRSIMLVLSLHTHWQPGRGDVGCPSWQDSKQAMEGGDNDNRRASLRRQSNSVCPDSTNAKAVSTLHTARI
jgi:hypothetical protein